MTVDPTRIVILGGGFAGAATAKRLEHLFSRDAGVEITLVDRENFSLFTPLLPEVLPGAIEPKHIVSPLRALLRRTTIRQAEIRAVDLSERVVLAAHCPACRVYAIRYDHLVLALGSVTNLSGLPGVAAHAFTMKSLADATALHAHVIDKFEHADMEPDRALRQELLTFVVAGGGFAGVETAAELNDFVRGAGRAYRNVRRDEVRVILIHVGPRILPEVSDALSAYALKKLRSRGVEVRLETRIEGCAAGRVRLSTGEEIANRTLVWTAGIVPNPLIAATALPKTAAGKVEVEGELRVKGHRGVWALGDCAAIVDHATGRSVPPTAQQAVRQGCRVAENIAAVIRRQAPKPFSHNPSGSSLGSGGDRRWRRCSASSSRASSPGGCGGPSTSSSSRVLSGRFASPWTGLSTSSSPRTSSTSGRFTSPAGRRRPWDHGSGRRVGGDSPRPPPPCERDRGKRFQMTAVFRASSRDVAQRPRP